MGQLAANILMLFKTRRSAIAEGLCNTLVSRNLAITNHPIWKRLQSIMTLKYIHPRASQLLLLD